MSMLHTTPAAAQGSTATLRGNVQDSTGGVLPGATVTLTNASTKGVQSVVTDERGQYLFAGLFPAATTSRSRCRGSSRTSAKGSR